ncbi:MAG: hypothetical protein HQL32_16835 [Planctomycetes bacterium]|nr:hypothetical protein [Planctomycetota bacterium]
MLKRLLIFLSSLCIICTTWALTFSSNLIIAPPSELGGDNRLQAYIQSDKAVYKGGDTLYVRVVVLDSSSRKPCLENHSIRMTLTDPKGSRVKTLRANLKEGSAGFSYILDENISGGEYTISTKGTFMGMTSTKRKIEVRAYRPSRLNMQITFDRDGYGPGDTVLAELDVKRSEGGLPLGAEVQFAARLDGQMLEQMTLSVDHEGKTQAFFTLPTQIERGEGSINFTVKDGGVIENRGKTLPILLQSVDLSLYPESGELVNGLPSRVYLQALTPAAKPADISGRIMRSDNQVAGHFSTTHEGRGVFNITPQSDFSYHLIIDEPSGITKKHPLPKALSYGAIITPIQKIFSAQEMIILKVSLSTEGSYKLTLRQREKVISSSTIVCTDSEGLIEENISFNIEGDSAGVLIATLENEEGLPIAERLIYKEQKDPFNIEITTNKEHYLPGDLVEVNVKTTNQRGAPLSAVLGITTSDERIREMLETREHPPSLPVCVFLESEVQELADAHIYLDKENPEAPQALDLLLGIQGWRRYCHYQIDKFKKAYPGKAEIILAEDKRRLLRTRMSKKGLRFSVKTPVAAAGVRGTAFNVNEAPIARLALDAQLKTS